MAEPDREEPKSFGNMSDAHWSRARAGTNEEALEYYRERSHAPGVEEGGGPRNFYCMHCDGVVPTEPPPSRCPHCGAEVSGVARRYFNWVELDQPAKSDFRSLLPWAAIGFALLALTAVAVIWLFA